MSMGSEPLRIWGRMNKKMMAKETAIPKSEVIADKLLRKFPEYNPNQRESFIKISGDLHDVTLKVLSKGPLDKKARIRELIESEKERFKDEKTSCEVAA